MSHVLPVTAQNFQLEVLESSVPVLVDLYATWCRPCRMLAPVLDRLAVELDGQAKFVKIDTDEQPELAEAFRVSSIPMLALIKDGQVVDASVGLVSPEQIRQMVRKAVSPAATASR
jgi:thioredoxin